MSVFTFPIPEEVTRPTESTVELQEKVRRRAYELYENRGREDGHGRRRLAASRVGGSR